MSIDALVKTYGHRMHILYILVRYTEMACFTDLPDNGQSQSKAVAALVALLETLEKLFSRHFRRKPCILYDQLFRP